MYPDVCTWNGMYGVCSHNCAYCYNRLHWVKWGKMRLNERALKENLGSGKFIFVGSSCDMFADDVPEDWISRVLQHCRRFDNTYLFQTKNPKRFEEFIGLYPRNVIWGITMETNRAIWITRFSDAPSTKERKDALMLLPSHNTMVSIEPIMDFDLNIFVKWLQKLEPGYISIGANTNKSVKLLEPSPEKVNALIEELKKFTEVKIKPNLKRIMEAN